MQKSFYVRTKKQWLRVLLFGALVAVAGRGEAQTTLSNIRLAGPDLSVGALGISAGIADPSAAQSISRTHPVVFDETLAVNGDAIILMDGAIIVNVATTANANSLVPIGGADSAPQVDTLVYAQGSISDPMWTAFPNFSWSNQASAVTSWMVQGTGPATLNGSVYIVFNGVDNGFFTTLGPGTSVSASVGTASASASFIGPFAGWTAMLSGTASASSGGFGFNFITFPGPGGQIFDTLSFPVTGGGTVAVSGTVTGASGSAVGEAGQVWTLKGAAAYSVTQ